MTKQNFIALLVDECDDQLDSIVYEKSNGDLVFDIALVGEIAYNIMMRLAKAGKDNGNQQKPGERKRKAKSLLSRGARKN